MLQTNSYKYCKCCKFWSAYISVCIWQTIRKLLIIKPVIDQVKEINNDGLTITSGYKSIRNIDNNNNNVIKFSLIYILGNLSGLNSTKLTKEFFFLWKTISLKLARNFIVLMTKKRQRKKTWSGDWVSKLQSHIELIDSWNVCLNFYSFKPVVKRQSY